ncbi:carbohydrate sulfotransferase 11-like [Liolophura sinensis]|uniref:carbohydrate sulfotransferase 11-like n=1 Tax=Liolophura sinensis TaxID=3198878 RepID=UPI00315925EF
MIGMCQQVGPRLAWGRKLGTIVFGLCLLVYIAANFGPLKQYLQEQEGDRGTKADIQGVFRGTEDDGSSGGAEAGDTYSMQQARNAERVSRVREVCDALGRPTSTQDTRSRLLIVRSRKFAICYVPKAGCTFWKRLILALQVNKTDIFEFTKNQAHSQSIDSVLKIPKFDAAYKFLSEATRVMFVRDPYSRLYSAYVDKFYLGDFWAMGRRIIQLVRRNATRESLACGHDLTFEEFLRYALKVSGDQSVQGPDEHWFPISKLCHPCTFDYHIIGKQETFSDDRDYVMDTVGISGLVNLSSTTEILARDGMKQTVDMAWDKLAKCMSRKDFCRRMWTSYITQGYIHSSQSFPEERINQNTSKEGFLKLAMEAYHQNPPTAEERKKQRQEAMINAYTTVSPKLLEQIRHVYDLDFQLFNYPIRPDELFIR